MAVGAAAQLMETNEKRTAKEVKRQFIDSFLESIAEAEFAAVLGFMAGDPAAILES